MTRGDDDLLDLDGRWRQLGRRLAYLRAAAGHTQHTLASLLHYGRSTIANVEVGRQRTPRRFWEQCDKALDTNGELTAAFDEIQRLRREAARQEWLPHAAPGGRQPGPSSNSRRDDLAMVRGHVPRHRAERAALVRRVPFQPGVLDRAALEWVTDDAELRQRDIWRCGTSTRVTEDDVLSAQSMLARYRELDHALGAGRVNANVQRYIEGELNRLLAAAPTSPEVGARLRAVAAGFFELGGYQAVDAGAEGLAQRRYLRALRLTRTAGDRVFGGYLLAVNIAHLALHCGHPEPALRIALAAVTGTGTRATPAVRAALHAVVARAQARLGREADCTAHLRVAEQQLARSQPGDEPDWIRYFTPAYLADEMAHCFHDLGRSTLARRHLGDALTGLRPSHVRRLAIDTALLASSLATDGRVDEACATARAAVDHAATTVSHRCVQRIVDVRADLDPYAGEPEVRELADYIRHRLPAAAA